MPRCLSLLLAYGNRVRDGKKKRKHSRGSNLFHRRTERREGSESVSMRASPIFFPFFLLSFSSFLLCSQWLLSSLPRWKCPLCVCFPRRFHEFLFREFSSVKRKTGLTRESISEGERRPRRSWFAVESPSMYCCAYERKVVRQMTVETKTFSN